MANIMRHKCAGVHGVATDLASSGALAPWRHTASGTRWCAHRMHSSRTSSVLPKILSRSASTVFPCSLPIIHACSHGPTSTGSVPFHRADPLSKAVRHACTANGSPALPQPSYRIDTELVDPLGMLPGYPQPGVPINSLALRNLRRELALGLPADSA
jgi:hypothetical protein